MDTEVNVSEYLTIASAAAALDVNPATIRRYIDSGELAAVQLGGRGSAVRISRRALDEWLGTTHPTNGRTT